MSGRLELRYRRLLWAYPRAYRNHRGAEIVTTLLEMAESGRARPTRRQAWHLIVCGLQERFRLPARRPLAWLGALLAAVILGAFGAAGATWLGWQTAASVPSDHELRALNAAMSGMPAPAAVYHNVSAMKGPGSTAASEGISNYDADRVRSALTSAGWQITSLQERDGAIGVMTGTDADSDTGLPGVRVPTRFIDYTATRGGLKLSGGGFVTTGGADLGLAGQANYATDVWPREPAAVRPLTVVGLIVGALAGWLVAAAFAQRLRGGRRLLATASGAVTLAALAVPAYAHYRDAYQVMAYAHGSPVPYIVYSPGDEIRVGTWMIVGLLALIAALVTVEWPRRVGAAPTGPDPADGTGAPELG